MNQALVLSLPGWLDSGPTHWQSLWIAEYGDLRVTQHDYQRPRRGDWMARLDEVIADHVLQSGQSCVLVAHSLGCHLVAAWAAHSQHAGAVRAALLVAPPDTTQADWPNDLHNWRTPVLQKLPFASSVVSSNNDPFGRAQSHQNMAAAWGAQLHSVGAKGHINGDSGLGSWPEGRRLLRGLLLASAAT